MVNVWSMTKKNYCFKTPFFAKNAIFSKIMSQSKECFWLIQAPYISKHISRKTAHNKVFILGQKGHFFLKKWRHHQKNVIVLNMYIGTNVHVNERWLVLKVWYTVGRPAGPTLLDSHCLCMWVKNNVMDDLIDLMIIYSCLHDTVYSKKETWPFTSYPCSYKLF